MKVSDFELGIKGIAYDPLRVEEGFLYIAIDIYTQLDGIEISDGHDGIDLAIKRGAIALILDKKREGEREFNLPTFYVEEPRLVLAQLAKEFYSQEDSFETIGVIGTNGKTSVSFLLYQFLNQQKQKSAAYLGTIGSFIGKSPYPSKDTTPEPVDLWQYRGELDRRNVDYSVMEVSSHGICFHRVHGLYFGRLIFTNITPDHLDYHKTFENYLAAKLKPFKEMNRESVALINLDVDYAENFKEASFGKVITYGIHQEAEVRASEVEFLLTSTKFTLSYNKESTSISAPFIGQHNLENILAVSATALSLGYSLYDLELFWPSCQQIPGRLERLESGNISVLIDYAHTTDAMEKVLSALEKECPGILRVVFGCGGDRDRKKRPLMGKVACSYADKVYLTQDNPRNEDPEQIFNDILAGCSKEKIVLVKDRREAIGKAITDSKPGDWVAILGKGHEKKQVVKGEMIPFDEKKIVEDYFKALNLTLSQPENL